MTSPFEVRRRLQPFGHASGRRHGHILAIGAFGLALGLVAGCTSDNHPVVRIVNHANVAVDVMIVDEGSDNEKVIETNMKPGMEVTYDRLPSDQCSPVQLVAKNQQGTEIARNVGPICRPSTWVIEMPGSSPGGS